MIIASFPVAFLLSTPLIGAKLKTVGRKNTIMIAMLIFIVSTVVFGLASYIQTPWLFFTVSLCARFAQGVADAANNTAIYAIISSRYPERKESFLVWISIAKGLACSGGPIIGSIVFNQL